MSINHQKLIRIVSEEVDKAPERCEGYRDELRDTIAEIVMLERSNRQQRIYNIQQQIDDKCNATGRLLADKQV